MPRQGRFEKMVFLLIFLMFFLFPFFFYIFTDTPVVQWITILVGISILILLWLIHLESVKQDKDIKGRNRVNSIYISGGLLVLVGISIVWMNWQGSPVTDPLHWIPVLVALFFLLRGLICFGAGSEYNKTINRLVEYETKVKHLEFELDELKQKLGQIPEEKKEKGDPFANVSMEWLLAEKEKYKHNKNFVKRVDDVLEARSKKTKKS